MLKIKMDLILSLQRSEFLEFGTEVYLSDVPQTAISSNEAVNIFS